MIPIVFQKISIWVIVLPFLVGIVNYKGLNHDAKWIFFLALIALPPQILTAFIPESDPVFALSYNLYTPIEFVIVYILFATKFEVGLSRVVVSASAVLFFIVYFFFVFKFGLQKRFLNELTVGCNVLYMFWTLLLLRQEYEAAQTFIEKTNPFTWFLLGIVLYSCGRIATMPLYHYIRNPQQSFLETLTIVDSVFNILLYLFFSVALLIRKGTLKKM